MCRFLYDLYPPQNYGNWTSPPPFFAHPTPRGVFGTLPYIKSFSKILTGNHVLKTYFVFKFGLSDTIDYK